MYTALLKDYNCHAFTNVAWMFITVTIRAETRLITMRSNPPNLEVVSLKEFLPSSAQASQPISSWELR